VAKISLHFIETRQVIFQQYNKNTSYNLNTITEEVSFWNMVREEYSIPDFLLNRCIRDMMGPPGCKIPRCPNVHEVILFYCIAFNSKTTVLDGGYELVYE